MPPMHQPHIFFEDFEPGAEWVFGAYEVTAEEIVAFATEFDPQPMHLSAEAGEASLLGGLGASGWHSCAILMRMMCDAFVLDAASWGAPGVGQLQMAAPGAGRRRPVPAGARSWPPSRRAAGRKWVSSSSAGR